VSELSEHIASFIKWWSMPGQTTCTNKEINLCEEFEHALTNFLKTVDLGYEFKEEREKDLTDSNDKKDKGSE